MSSESPSQDRWLEYLASLNWGPGGRDQSGWLAFLRAASLNVDPSIAVQEVAQRIGKAGGQFSTSKITSQQKRAYNHVGNELNCATSISPAPKAAYDQEKLKAVAGQIPGINEAWLIERSPVSPLVTPSQFLDQLYFSGEKIIVFTDYQSQGQHAYRIGSKDPLPEGGPAGVWFLANPVDGEYHENPRQENKLSRRSEESVTAWRYLVLESDVADTNDWLSCLVQLPVRIAAIYTSGGRSIHALVRIDAESKPHWDEERNAIKPIVVTLGADAGALTAVRLTRLPGTMRGDQEQRLLYLNPHPTGRSIYGTSGTKS